MQLELKKPYDAVVVSVTGDGTYTDRNNTLQYKNTYTLKIGENEYHVSVTSDKTPDAEFKKDDKVVCTIGYMNDRGMLGALRKPGSNNFSKKTGGWQPKTIKDSVREQMARNPSMAVAYAQQYYAANATVSDQPPADHIIAIADPLLTWMNEETLKLLNEEKLK